MYQVTKTYGHNLGLSACFRQHRAKSHCSFLHGYALSFSFIFAAETLDQNNWVIDFGGLKLLKLALETNFDHRLIVAKDDPHLDDICILAQQGVADVLVMEKVGCEAFADVARSYAQNCINDLGQRHRVWLHSVECREHGANSALVVLDKPEWIK